MLRSLQDINDVHSTKLRVCTCNPCQTGKDKLPQNFTGNASWWTLDSVRWNKCINRNLRLTFPQSFKLRYSLLQIDTTLCSGNTKKYIVSLNWVLCLTKHVLVLVIIKLQMSFLLKNKIFVISIGYKDENKFLMSFIRSEYCQNRVVC